MAVVDVAGTIPWVAVKRGHRALLISAWLVPPAQEYEAGNGHHYGQQQRRMGGPRGGRKARRKRMKGAGAGDVDGGWEEVDMQDAEVRAMRWISAAGRLSGRCWLPREQAHEGCGVEEVKRRRHRLGMRSCLVRWHATGAHTSAAAMLVRLGGRLTPLTNRHEQAGPPELPIKHCYLPSSQQLQTSGGCSLQLEPDQVQPDSLNWPVMCCLPACCCCCCCRMPRTMELPQRAAGMSAAPSPAREKAQRGLLQQPQRRAAHRHPQMVCKTCATCYIEYVRLLLHRQCQQ
jgi:hypothetical protein